MGEAWPISTGRQEDPDAMRTPRQWRHHLNFPSKCRADCKLRDEQRSKGLSWDCSRSDKTLRRPSMSTALWPSRIVQRARGTCARGRVAFESNALHALFKFPGRGQDCIDLGMREMVGEGRQSPTARPRGLACHIQLRTLARRLHPNFQESRASRGPPYGRGDCPWDFSSSEGAVFPSSQPPPSARNR